MEKDEKGHVTRKRTKKTWGKEGRSKQLNNHKKGEKGDERRSSKNAFFKEKNREKNSPLNKFKEIWRTGATGKGRWGKLPTGKCGGRKGSQNKIGGGTSKPH